MSGHGNLPFVPPQPFRGFRPTAASANQRIDPLARLLSGHQLLELAAVLLSRPLRGSRRQRTQKLLELRINYCKGIFAVLTHCEHLNEFPIA